MCGHHNINVTVAAYGVFNGQNYNISGSPVFAGFIVDTVSSVCGMVDFQKKWRNMQLRMIEVFPKLKRHRHNDLLV